MVGCSSPHVASTMSLRTVRSARSLQSLKQSLHTSSTAPKPSHLLSTSRDNVHSHYASLTVNALKQECRTRGLKLNGRKNDLVDRLVGFEQTKAFSSKSGKANVSTPRSKVSMKFKPDTSSFSTSTAAEHPDAVQITIPRVPPTARELNKPKFRMPVQPENTNGAVEIDADYTKHDVTTDPGASLGDVHVVDGAPKVSTMNVDLGDGSPKHEEERTGSTQGNSVSSGDKTFLAVLGGAIAAWWGSKYLEKPKVKSGAKH